jgi:hypothetical protein
MPELTCAVRDPGALARLRNKNREADCYKLLGTAVRAARSWNRDARTGSRALSHKTKLYSNCMETRATQSLKRARDCSVIPLVDARRRENTRLFRSLLNVRWSS